jgi:hypothetical protein
MTRAYVIPLLLMLAACGNNSRVESQDIRTVSGNRLQVTRGISDDGRFISVENLDKHWVGKYKGGKEKWSARLHLLDDMSAQEIHDICGEWFFKTKRTPIYEMMDKDETMGGMAPILGMAASMAAHVAAYESTDPRNVPVSIYREYGCRSDKN